MKVNYTIDEVIDILMQLRIMSLEVEAKFPSVGYEHLDDYEKRVYVILRSRLEGLIVQRERVLMQMN